jgi:hypothetical protein
MEIRLILFKEIGFGISLNNPPDWLRIKHLSFQKGKIRKTIFPS